MAKLKVRQHKKEDNKTLWKRMADDAVMESKTRPVIIVHETVSEANECTNYFRMIHTKIKLVVFYGEAEGSIHNQVAIIEQMKNWLPCKEEDHFIVVITTKASCQGFDFHFNQSCLAASVLFK